MTGETHAGVLDSERIAALISRGDERDRQHAIDALTRDVPRDARAVHALLRSLGDNWWVVGDGELPAPGALFPDAYRELGGRESAQDALALVLYAEVVVAWDKFWDQRPLRATVDVVLGTRQADIALDEDGNAAADVDVDIDDDDDTDPRELERIARRAGSSGAVWALYTTLRLAFTVYSASLTGNLGLVCDATRNLVETLSNLAPSLAGARGYEALIGDLHDKAEFYEHWHTAAAAARAFLAREDEAELGLASAASELRAYLNRPGRAFVHVAEIRNQLGALESLQDRENAGWLFVDEGAMVVLYPFGVRSPESAEGARALVRAVTAAHGGRATSDAAGAHAQQPWQLAGTTAVRGGLRHLDVDDAWSADGDSALGRRYDGRRLIFPDLVLDMGPAGDRVWRIGVQARFSLLGNHHLRFEIPLESAGPDVLAQAALLSSPIFGDTAEMSGVTLRWDSTAETMSGPPSTRSWARLTGVADAMLADLEMHLHASPDTTDDARATSLIVHPGGMSSVVTVISQATLLPPLGTGSPHAATAGPLISATSMTGTFGLQPLVHPAPTGTISIADWANYDLDRIRPVRNLSLNREFIRTNANVAVIASFHSPHYAVASVQSFIEFAYSLHGMHAAWQQDIALHATWLSARLDELDLALDRFDALLSEVDAALAGSDEDGAWAALAALTDARERLDDAVRTVERRQLRLKKMLVSAQATQHFVLSPTLVDSPSHREDILALLKATGMCELNGAFDRAKNDVVGDRVHDLLQAVHRRAAEHLAREERRALLVQQRKDLIQQRKEERADARQTFWSTMISIVLGLTGVAGVYSVAQAGYGLEGRPTETTWFVAALAAVVVVILIGALSVELVRAMRRARRAGSAP